MYSKIAINNVKKSFKDYTIYFLTIAFAVCIFYSFNSIESQKALLDMNKNQAEYMSLVTTLISYVSVFVSFILGGLILFYLLILPLYFLVLILLNFNTCFTK